MNINTKTVHLFNLDLYIENERERSSLNNNNTISKINDDLNKTLEGLKIKYRVHQVASVTFKWVAIGILIIFAVLVLANDLIKLTNYFQNNFMTANRNGNGNLNPMVVTKQYDMNVFLEVRKKDTLIAWELKKLKNTTM